MPNFKKVNRIKEILAEHNRELKENFKVKEIGIFGSYLRDEQKARSDVDILVGFIEEPTLFQFIKLEDFLGKILGVKVDLVMKNALKPEIGRHILSEVVYL